METWSTSEGTDPGGLAGHCLHRLDSTCAFEPEVDRLGQLHGEAIGVFDGYQKPLHVAMSKLGGVRLVPKGNPFALQSLEFGVHVLHVQCEMVALGTGTADQLRIGDSRGIFQRHEIHRPHRVLSKDLTAIVAALAGHRQSHCRNIKGNSVIQVRYGHDHVD